METEKKEKSEKKETKKTSKVSAKKTEKKTASKKSEKTAEKETKISKADELKAKAKALEAKFKESETKDIKGEVTGEKEEKKDMLVTIEDYLKSSIHLGTRVITPHMKKYVYRRRADGLAVFNTDMLDDEMKKAADYLKDFDPEKMVIICKREAGWHAVKMFGETFGIKTFTKKYPAGVLTNTNLKDFFEVDLVFICDPWLDKNALRDANITKTKVFSICDTNNYTFGIDHLVPGNNKSAKSIGMILHLLGKLYAEKRNMDVKVPTIQEFVPGWDELVPPK